MDALAAASPPDPCPVTLCPCSVRRCAVDHGAAWAPRQATLHAPRAPSHPEGTQSSELLGDKVAFSRERLQASWYAPIAPRCGTLRA